MIKAVESRSLQFTYKELARISREMSAGKGAGPESRPPADPEGLKPVIVQLPEGRLFHQPEVYKDTLKQLKKDGFKVDRKFPELQLFSGRIKPQLARKLKDCGFSVYDDSEREFLPPIPAASQVPELQKNEKKSWELREVDPTIMTGVQRLRETEGLTGKGVGVAVIDSGFDYPDYQPAEWHDFTPTASPLPEDQLGHGTHTVSDVLKMAPEAKIFALRVLGPDGGGKTSDIIKALQWVIENKDEKGIQVVNLSLGSPAIMPWQVDMLGKVVGQAVEAGLTVVTPAGNDGPKAKTICSPGDVPDSITVGSLKDEYTVSDFSAHGPTFTGEAKPDVMAPGEGLVSWNPKNSLLAYNGRQLDKLRAMNPQELREYFKKNSNLILYFKLPFNILRMPDEEMEEKIKTSLPGYYYPAPGYLAAPGTSFSAPEVAGITALLLQKNPDLTPQQVREALMETACPVDETASPLIQGRGLVQADKAAGKVKKRNA